MSATALMPKLRPIQTPIAPKPRVKVNTYPTGKPNIQKAVM
jgi:hypothetical protein